MTEVSASDILYTVLAVFAVVAGKVTKRLEEQGRAFYGRRGWEWRYRGG